MAAVFVVAGQGSDLAASGHQRTPPLKAVTFVYEAAHDRIDKPPDCRLTRPLATAFPNHRHQPFAGHSVALLNDHRNVSRFQARHRRGRFLVWFAQCY